MDQTLELLDAILNDEISSAREAFHKSVAQKVAELSSTGNRLSTALLSFLEALAKEELRRRAAVILACSTKLTPPSLISLGLDTLASWAQDRLLGEKADIEAVIAGVDMGEIQRHASFLDEVARSSSSRLGAELAAFVHAASSSELDVAAEAPDFVRKAKWVFTKGRRNWRWLALGLLLLLVLAVLPRLLPPRIASVVGLEHKESAPPSALGALPALPGDTGWIFAGYFDIERETFIEGPWVSVVDTSRRGQRRFVEIGDTIKLKVSRPVIMARFQEHGTKYKLISPVNVGVVEDTDKTGIVLPAGTELLVRDVSEGAWPGNPNAALWLRVIYVPR